MNGVSGVARNWVAKAFSCRYVYKVNRSCIIHETVKVTFLKIFIIYDINYLPSYTYGCIVTTLL